MTLPPRTDLVLRAVPGVGEVETGTDLATLLEDVELLDGDVVVVTSKIVSKAEGRVTDVPKETALASETRRVVARRGPTTIARTHHGLVMAAAGIDASNVHPGRLVLLPADPDSSARRLRHTLADRRGVNVAVVISDTAGRAWRVGQTDIAVGAAGLRVLDDHAGRIDGYGNPLAVTMPAVADEVAGAAELATGKLSMSPITVVRGLAPMVLPHGRDGAGAASLVRPEAEDMFGLGSREAVVAALGGDAAAFGSPAGADDLASAVRDCLDLLARSAVVHTEGDRVVVSVPDLAERVVGSVETALAVLATAHGWSSSGVSGGRAVLVRTTP